MNDSDFESIDNLKGLESLNISGNIGLNFNCPQFFSVIKRLKYLDISHCQLNEKDLNIIFEHATKLEYLKFNSNYLNKFPDKSHISSDIVRNLKVLKLNDCGLISTDLENILIFDNLIEIDLSFNDFSEINETILNNLFGSDTIEVTFIESSEIKSTKNLKFLKIVN